MNIMSFWINLDLNKFWLKPIIALSHSHDLKVVVIDKVYGNAN
ncbi:MAG: hypothetical protein BWZ00_00938 [Bacteroidetes bacterium ADurb.BinA174]|jgi:hypothetical protein|nr:MAG: hypothetical protein BWZ00_00938 [Bacteroidetes bacterium ADurb.BinA174]